MRKLTDKFISDLKNGGLLYPILERVKRDNTLCLQIRNNYVNIYYRGGNIMKIAEKNNYEVKFDIRYCINKRHKSIIRKLPEKFLDSKSVTKWTNAIPILKETMDFWFNRNPKEEREFQQLVLRENNGSVVGCSTDYFIVDIEYDDNKGARFDMVTIRWDSDGICRKLQRGYKPKISFIEVKYGDNALNGKAGMLKHIEDFKKFLNCTEPNNIREEMLLVFRQLRELKLIPALEKNLNDVKEFSDIIEYIFILANHDPSSKKLYDAISKIKEEYRNEGLKFDIKFCISNFMGYGLYKENMFNLTEFKEQYSRQIYSKSKL